MAHRAADIARATADIVLLEDRLDGLAMLRGLAAETLALITPITTTKTDEHYIEWDTSEGN